jgi:hypothetical protein
MKHFCYFIVFISVLAVSSCKRYADPPPVFEEGDSLVVKAPRKVLLIAIDGVPGAEMKAIMPPTIASILPHSKYSWDAISEVVTTTVASWKTLLSGVNASRHNILGYDSTFSTVVTNVEDETGHITYYPSLFNYILTTPQNDLRTAFVTEWRDLTRYGAPEIADPILAPSDAAVKDSVVNLLKNKNEDIIIANFSAPARAGLQYGFSAAVPEYKASVTQTDAYIGEVLNALKTGRASYAKEEWLVIIASTHGGVNKTFGGASEPEKRTFLIYHNDLLKQQEFTAEGVYSATQFSGNSSSASWNVGKAYNTDDEFNFGTTGKQLTIQFNLKATGGANYISFFGKRSNWVTSNSGWHFYFNTSSWCMSIVGNNSERKLETGMTSVGNIFDNSWHNLAMAVYDSAGKRWIKRILDGKRLPDPDAGTYNREITSFGNIANTDPLYLGWGIEQKYNAITFSIANLASYNTLLSDAEIANYGCLTAANIATHPKYANLVAYYPCNDAFGGQFNNIINPAKPVVLEGNFSWSSVSLVPCSFPATTPPAGKLVRQWYNVDIASQILYWFRLDDWKKEGNRWLQEFDVEFIK